MLEHILRNVLFFKSIEYLLFESFYHIIEIVLKILKLHGKCYRDIKDQRFTKAVILKSII